MDHGWRVLALKRVAQWRRRPVDGGWTTGPQASIATCPDGIPPLRCPRTVEAVADAPGWWSARTAQAWAAGLPPDAIRRLLSSQGVGTGCIEGVHQIESRARLGSSPGCGRRTWPSGPLERSAGRSRGEALLGARWTASIPLRTEPITMVMPGWAAVRRTARGIEVTRVPDLAGAGAPEHGCHRCSPSSTRSSSLVADAHPIRQRGRRGESCAPCRLRLTTPERLLRCRRPRGPGCAAGGSC